MGIGAEAKHVTPPPQSTCRREIRGIGKSTSHPTTIKMMIRIILIAHHQKQLFKKLTQKSTQFFLPENHFEKTLDMCLSYYYIYYYILNTTTIGITFCKTGKNLN